MFRGVQLSHQHGTAAPKLATNPENKTPVKALTVKFSQNMTISAYQIFHLNYFWYKLYFKVSELHLVILSIDWS